MASGSALGEFLRARRAQLRPVDVGLDAGSRRRVPGLRREEVAALAGISADYFLRIEQGRVETPSSQVVSSLARVLQLDEAATAHLRLLARPDARTSSDQACRVMADTEVLLDQLAVPAFVASRYLDCLAANPLARALSPSFAPGRNLIYQLFLDPSERRLHLDWEDAAVSVVGGLRQAAGATPDDSRLNTIVDDLSEHSDEFRAYWASAPVGYRPSGESHLLHPLAGELHLRRHRFDVPDSGKQHLHLYHAEPGTSSADGLDRLRRLTGT